jgi:alanine racemase
MHATLTIHLSALRANYRLLRGKLPASECAGVVKANAYGLGVEAISRALWDEGCRSFFVATLEEALELRGVLPEADIAIFSGPQPGEEGEYRAHRLTPVCNTLEQYKRWVDGGWWIVDGKKAPFFLHIDTGMTRLGLNETDLRSLITSHHPPATSHHLLSHLACANDPKHPKNAEQLSRFRAALALFPGAKASLANSAGIFLGADYHFDLARPGCALYGINPIDGENPMQPVATLSAPILQIRTLERDETVGYGATCYAPKGARIAIAALGYADGLLRGLSNCGHAYVAGARVPILGRVSMDMAALDVSQLPEAALATASQAEFLNKAYDVNAMAADCQTIGYEIFTRIGNRVARVYA